MFFINGDAVKNLQQIVWRPRVEGGRRVVGLPFLRRRRLSDSGTVDGSGAVSGPGPDLDPSGALPPLGLESGRSPCGTSRTTSPWFSPFRDSTSASSVGSGEEAVGSEALFTSDESKEPLVESSS